MSRSLKKGPYIDPNVMKKVKRAKESGDRSPIKTWSRSCTITPEMVGLTFAVHRGNDFEEVYIEENMVGHKLGEFAKTRIFREHSNRKMDEELF